MPDGGEIEIAGQIGFVTDVNLFDLGPVNAGDRVVAEVDGVGGFDPTSALFDADGNLLLLNDDSNFFAGLLGSRLDLVVAAATALMQTFLPAELLATDRGKEADSILRACVHCGFCTATCPTYQVLGNELDSPRGRIYLIKAMLEGEAVTALTRTHLDRCLGCQSCETTCPSGVNYHRLLDIGRAEVEQRVPRSPRFTAALGAQYEFDLGTLGWITPRVDFYYRDTISFRQFGNPDDKQESFTRTDLRLTWASPDRRYWIEAFVRNLEDEAVKTNQEIHNGINRVHYYDPPINAGFRMGIELGG